MADLANLIERVEKLTGPDEALDLAIARSLVPDVVCLRSVPGSDEPEPFTRYTASLDAVVALVERVRPGIAWTLGKNVHHGTWGASLNELVEGEPRSLSWGQSKTPALALLLALLRSMEADNG